MFRACRLMSVIITEEEITGEANAICISAAALGDMSAPEVTTMKLRVLLQGH